MAVLIVSPKRLMQSLLLQAAQKQSITALVFDGYHSAIRRLQQPASTLPSLVLVEYDGHKPAFNEFIQQIRLYAEDQYFAVVAVVEDLGQVNQCADLVDDVLVQPFTATQVEFKLKTHLRAMSMFRRLENERDGLAGYHKNVCVEQDLVNKIFAVQCESQLQRLENVRHKVSAQAMFNGDFFLTQQGPAGSIYLLMAHANGTGLPATMASTPAFSVFRAMSQKGLPVGSIAAELNRVLPSNIPDGMPVGATLVELNKTADQLSVWSGGMPPAVIIDSQGFRKDVIPSQHPPLADIDELDFCQDVAVYPMKATDRVILVTDSLAAVENYEHIAFGEERFLGLFVGNRSSGFETVLKAYNDFTEGAPQSTDFALAEIFCNPALMPTAQSNKKTAVSIPWQLVSRLNADDLKAVSPVPQLVKFLSNAVGLDVHQDYISTILSELFNNALEHGLLGLSSEMKLTEDGFLEYYMQRENRLAELDQGWIEVGITLLQRQVEISIHDSGPGFDYQSLQSADEDNAFGRGMSIIKSVCDTFQYSHGGAKVVVQYSLDT